MVQGQEVLDRLANFDELSTLDASYLDEATHCFRNRSDLQLEARYNQGGVAAFSAYVHHKKELFPFNLTVFGRGKLEGAEEDIFKVNEPGFAPVRDGPNLDGHASAVRKVIEWSEYISQQRLKGNFPLDYHPDDREFNHHNEVVLNYWIHTGLL